MSQIASSSGVRVAAQPLSNVYTVLLLLGTVALVATLVMLCVTMNDRYGVILAATKEGKQAKREARKAARDEDFPEAETKTHYDQGKAKLDEGDENIKQFPEGVAAPAVEGETTPPAPAAPTPPAPAATTPPAPAAPTPPAPAATTPPAPAAPTPPAPEATTPPAGDATTPAPEGGATPPATTPSATPAAGTPAAGAPAAN